MTPLKSLEKRRSVIAIRSLPHKTFLWENKKDDKIFDLINEEPLSIRIEGKDYTVIMRTPGEEHAHIAGFCLAEGIIDAPSDIVQISFCEETDINVATITLKKDRKNAIPDILGRKSFISQTSCGICGKQIIDDLFSVISKVNRPETLSPDKALTLIDKLNGVQALRQKTRASHGAAIYGADLNLLAHAEDVGRHNALDKAIGKAFLDKTLGRAIAVVLSSRVSYELVQRVARAKIPFILSVSRPTALAVEVAQRFNITLACLSKYDGLMIFCNKDRWDLTPTSD